MSVIQIPNKVIKDRSRRFSAAFSFDNKRWAAALPLYGFYLKTKEDALAWIEELRNEETDDIKPSYKLVGLV